MLNAAQIESSNKAQLRALIHQIRGLPISIKNKMLAFGTRAAASVIQKRAKLNCPVGTGIMRGVFKRKAGFLVSITMKRLHLRDTIKIVKMRSFDKSESTYIVHAGRGRRTAHLVEFGTAPHYVAGTMKIGGKVIRGYWHPGTSPRPFMRPALDAGTAAPIDAMRKKINKRLMKVYGVKR